MDSKHPYFREIKTKGFISAFRNGFAPVKIFNAIPKSSIYHGNGDASLWIE